MYKIQTQTPTMNFTYNKKGKKSHLHAQIDHMYDDNICLNRGFFMK